MKTQKGFTFIELVLVISSLAVISAAALAAIQVIQVIHYIGS